ncbi:MAG: polyphenol oxidase family protein [Coriobacteriales bacterium]|nr:polyphenol oxidase family protein [Coriobacteriales bacterium]
MTQPRLERTTSQGVTLLGDTACPGGVTFAFTERTGGVSSGRYASLNLGDACGDDPERVLENRRRALDAIGAAEWADALICPMQVHGDRVLVVGRAGLVAEEARRVAREGVDAVVCTQPHVPVLLCCADCVPIVLVAPSAFAVVHSGWRGTLARISAHALFALADAAGCAVGDVRCYIGPHVGRDDYRVSGDLLRRFEMEFGPQVCAGEQNLDLDAAVTCTLLDAGARADAIAHARVSTASSTHRFFSYRASGGKCGRHGALAVLAAPGQVAHVANVEKR